MNTRPTFEPRNFAHELLPLIEALRQSEKPEVELPALVRRFPKQDGTPFSKTEIIRGFRHFAVREGWQDEAGFVARLRMKPVRTSSGVAPVTVLTKPFPCPGKCIFCPSDVRMPKSYLAREPGAQRAAQHRFDPYGQTLGRLLTYYQNGHQVDKVELIVLGGTWSFYPEAYQIYFIKRCFDAMNDFSAALVDQLPTLLRGSIAFEDIDEQVDGLSTERTYNQVVSRFLRLSQGGELDNAEEAADWAELAECHRRNETATARCVGLVVETRPDHLTEEEVVRIRRLGATKVQIGFQSLSDAVLAANHRGHDVAATRRAVSLLRAAGFKLHAHWMPNLLGSSPDLDKIDYEKIFDDADFRPDELKIYPCSLVETAELMRFHRQGLWQPYSQEELLDVLSHCLLHTPEYCRLTRIIRDIPGDEIVVGNKTTNFRELVEKRLLAEGKTSRDIRAREVRHSRVEPESLTLRAVRYGTSVGEEVFLQFVDPEERIAGFCRLSLPANPVAIPEIAHCAMIREVHVYGVLVAIGEAAGGRSQHLGLGRRLVEAAEREASSAGFVQLAVISAIGTRAYYRNLGFENGELYLIKTLSGQG